ncbi:sugar phosphate isomerase/epimerase family protein [Candidatus Latescibacterota bacterium]
MTRRKALAAGTASAGILFGAMPSKSEAFSMSKTWGEDFLTPFSPAENIKRNLIPGKTPIRLSCNGHCIHYKSEMNIGSVVKSVRDAGYTAAEGNDEWKNATDSEIREFKAALKEHDILFYTIHRCINNIHPDAIERRQINKRTAENVETAERLDLSFIVSHTGSCNPNPTRPHRDNWTKETWKRSVDAFKQILKDTSGSKVALAIEAINPSNINNPRAHVKLREDVGDSRIKVTLDPQNMLNLSTYYRTTELVNECFELLGEDICYMHCKDVKIANSMLPAFEWVVAGTGTMDFELCLAQLSRMKYTRPYFQEFLPEEKYPEAKKYIENTADKVGVKIYS